MTKIWHALRPPSGDDARKLVAWYLLAFGIVRVMGLPATRHLEYLPWFAYGGLKIAFAVALLLTNGCKRLSITGRIISATAAAFCAMLAVDALPAWNGFVTYAIPALVLLQQAADHEC